MNFLIELLCSRVISTPTPKPLRCLPLILLPSVGDILSLNVSLSSNVSCWLNIRRRDGSLFQREPPGQAGCAYGGYHHCQGLSFRPVQNVSLCPFAPQWCDPGNLTHADEAHNCFTSRNTNLQTCLEKPGDQEGQNTYVCCSVPSSLSQSQFGEVRHY